MTPWYPPEVSPVRDGLYLRDYTNTPEGGWHFDYWLSNGDVGFWYVQESISQWDDAYYTQLPWRGLTRSEYQKENIND